MVMPITHPTNTRRANAATSSASYRSGVLFCLLVWWFLFAGLAQESNPGNQLSQADRDLTATYAQSLARLSSENQLALREAERAWITFTEKNWAAWSVLQATKPFTNDVMKSFAVTEIRRRSSHLEIFFLSFRFPYEDSKKVRDELDSELSSVYASCMRNISPEAGAALRDAQRAWILYRDLDADAAVLAARQANRGPMRGYAAKSHLTRERTIQLRESYLKVSANSAPEPSPESDTNPAKENDASVEQFRKEAQTFLKGLIASSEAPLFGKVESLKKLPSFQKEFTEAVTTFDLRATELADGIPLDLRQRIANEIAATQMLRKWLEGMLFLKDGAVEEAARSFSGTKAHQPKALASDYLPIWNAVDSWETLVGRLVPEYREHVKRAESLGNRGKISEAIREYEAALEIIENPELSKAIQGLRKQSLGL